jgi:hypothetical protein
MSERTGVAIDPFPSPADTAPANTTPTNTPADAPDASTRMIRGGATGAVVRLGRLDPITCDAAVSMVFFLDRAVEDERLAEGLARMLDHVPLFAGRLRDGRGGLEIVCGGDGVPFVAAEADLTLEEAIAAAMRSTAVLVDHADTRATGSGDGPLLCVRATRLRGGAMALGVSYNHLLGDNRSLALAMQAWSAFVDGREPPQVTVPADRERFLDALLPAADTGQSSYRLMDPPEAAEVWGGLAGSMETSTVLQVQFTQAEAEVMRKTFARDAGRALTENDALCAHLLDTLCRLDDDTETRRLGFPVDIRPYLKVPPSMVGNLINVVDIARVPGTPPEALAGAVRDAAKDFLRTQLNLRADLAFIESCDTAALNGLIARAIDPKRRVLLLSNVGGFGRSDFTFGGRQPAFFCPVRSPTGFRLPWMGVISRGFRGRGHLCTLVLPDPVAQELRRSPGNGLLHRFRPLDDPSATIASPIPDLI